MIGLRNTQRNKLVDDLSTISKKSETKQQLLDKGQQWEEDMTSG